MDRINLSTNTIWEGKVAYSRGVRVGDMVEISGTVANDGKGPVHIGDAYQQTLFILDKIEKSLNALGAKRSEITRTRVYLTNMKDWDDAGKAHGLFFNEINPASAMIQVAGLASPDYLIEIEATAVIGSNLKQSIVLE